MKDADGEAGKAQKAWPPASSPERSATRNFSG